MKAKNNKFKKVLGISMSVLMLSATTFPLVACQKNGEEVDPNKTQFHIGNFDGGYGHTWLEQAVEKFEKNWVIDALMYEHALKNVDQKSIDLLVEEYRKSLIVQNYKQLLINQRLKDPSEEEISDYYEKYSSQFLLEDDIVKGIFVKVPKKADKLRKMRKWVEEFSVENIENMENYSVKNYGTLDFFTEYWVFERELMKQLPTTIDIKLTPNKFFEMEDSVYVYMLNVLDYRKIGEIEPLDFAQDKIKNLLLNKQKIEFIRQFEEELYQQFKKDIMYFTSNKEEVEQ